MWRTACRGREWTRADYFGGFWRGKRLSTALDFDRLNLSIKLSPEMSQTTGIKYVVSEQGRRRNWNEKKKKSQTRKERRQKET